MPHELKTVLKNINVEQQCDDKMRKIINEIKIKESPKFQIFNNNTLYKLIRWTMDDSDS